ncbi:MAG: sigma-54-dependent Fis family transcriptional regulator, partial [Treponema sp.]|nr:sigma-54-dependent Fis family transcriptional regulator [Treponema sp.]
MKFTILIIDDEKNIREGLAADFEMDGYNVKIAANGKEGLDLIANGDIDLVITDLRMPGSISGEEVLRQVTTKMPGIPVIVLTGHGSIDAAVKAMQDGAYDFLTKPLNLAQLEVIVKRALEGRELKIKHTELLKQVSTQKKADMVIGKSAAMQKVMTLVKKVADARISVLITGE